MHHTPQRRRGPALYLSVGALAVAGLGATPAGALASTITGSADGKTLTFQAQGVNQLSIHQAGPDQPLTFSDAGPNTKIEFDAASNCSLAADGVAVTCPAPMDPDKTAYPLQILLGSHDDSVDVDAWVRSRIDGGDGLDTMLGSHLGDRIDGATGRDTVNGREGNDAINTWGNLPDTVQCGLGKDYVLADAADTVDADCEIVDRDGPTPGTTPGVDPTPGTGTGTGTGTSTGGGTTTAPGGAAAPSDSAGQVVPQVIAGACKNNVNLTEGFDATAGTAAGDNILAFGGNDRVAGLAGDDCVFGGAGNDRLSGGDGLDFVSGEAGNDRLAGDAGNDGITGGLGNDRAAGGLGDDRVAGDVGSDRLAGDAGVDALYGGAGKDRLVGGADADKLFGGAGRDVISARDGSRDRIDCGSGRDKVSADRDDKVARNCEVVKRSR